MIVRNAKLWLVRKGIGSTYFSFSRDLTVHTAALRELIMKGKTTPEEIGKTIFNRVLNFKPASIDNIGYVRPHRIDIDRQAIKEYKVLIASLPREIRAKWDEAIAQRIIGLGRTNYDLEIFGKTEKAPFIQLSFEVSKLLNELGLM